MKRFICFLLIVTALCLPVFIFTSDATSASRGRSDITSFSASRRAPALLINGATEAYSAAYTENASGSAVVNTDATITATTAGDLKYATFTISPVISGDTFDTSLVNSTFATDYIAATGKLTISNDRTFAQYLTALKAVKFLSTSDNPTAVTREISILVSNGNNDSATNTATVVMTVANDSPALYMGDAATLDYDTAYVGGTTGIALCTTAVNIVDPDDTYMESMAVLLSNAKTSDVLLTSEVDLTGLYTVVNDTATPGAITVTLTGHRTIAQYKAAAQLIKFYNPETSEIDTTSRVVYSVASDGDVNSTNATTVITVTAP